MDVKIERLGLLLGNGPYSVELLDGLEETYSPYKASVLPKDESSLSSKKIDFFGTATNFEAIVKNLKSASVSHVVLGGDLGLNRVTHYFRNFISRGGVFSSVNYEIIFKYGINVSVSKLLHEAEELLKSYGIVSVLASDLMPNLKPDEGVMVGNSELLSEFDMQQLLNQAMVEIAMQPRMFVRQTVALDGDVMIGYEAESTDKLLRKLVDIEKPAHVKRVLLKLCPREFSPTIDAPVIGVDTIEHCKKASVDVLMIDCKYGIISKKEETLEIASRANIAVIGVDPHK